MKNKSFKSYYDEIQVDENLIQQIPIKNIITINLF